MSEVPESSSEEGDAAQAFEELHLDVLIVRREVEKLSQAAPPDYTVTLGEIKKGLNQVSSRLATIEKHPALQMTPAIHQQVIAESGRVVMREAINQLDEARGASERTQQQLAAMIGSARHRAQQRAWLLVTAAAALIVGLLGSPLLARFLPFGLDGRVAAAVMAADRWHAGALLMEAGNPDGWHALEAAAALWQANQAALTTCREAAAKTRKEQHCTILVPAP